MGHDCDLASDPDGCIKCKLRYWRDGAGIPVRYVGGKKRFHNDTIGEIQRRTVAEAAAKGNTIEPVSTIYTGP